MKKTILILMMLLITSLSYAAGLDVKAQFIKEKHPKLYEKTIENYAYKEWQTDFSMVVYEINKQSDALVDLIQQFKGEYTNIVFQAVQKWSRDKHKQSNIDLFIKIKTFGLKEMIEFHCDWSMVKYEYEKQVKAKNNLK